MTDQSANSLTVSVVSYHSPVEELSTMLSTLSKALTAVRRCDAGATLNISLIDNSEDNRLELKQFEGLKDELAVIDCEFKLLQGHGNIGYGAAHNLVISKCKTSKILLMNPDVALQQSSLTEGLTFLKNHPDVSAVSPYAEFENGNKQYLCKRYPSVLNFFLRGFLPVFLRILFSKRLAKFEMRELSEDQPSLNIPIISGCFMLCRTEELKKVKGFDPGYFLYFEDFDLSLRLGKSSSLAYLPSMKIVHQGGHSARKGLRHIRLFVSSGKRFFSTHGWRWV